MTFKNSRKMKFRVKFYETSEGLWRWSAYLPNAKTPSFVSPKEYDKPNVARYCFSRMVMRSANAGMQVYSEDDGVWVEIKDFDPHEFETIYQDAIKDRQDEAC